MPMAMLGGSWWHAGWGCLPLRWSLLHGRWPLHGWCLLHGWWPLHGWCLLPLHLLHLLLQLQLLLLLFPLRQRCQRCGSVVGSDRRAGRCSSWCRCTWLLLHGARGGSGCGTRRLLLRGRHHGPLLLGDHGSLWWRSSRLLHTGWHGRARTHARLLGHRRPGPTGSHALRWRSTHRSGAWGGSWWLHTRLHGALHGWWACLARGHALWARSWGSGARV
mmetsp:Transcript_28932/g.63799  ORF Transcript_28932/g.63799 Transcript_28932/m.63799 type:complete len:218 (+) Transcript_28932:995-1648(+)